MLLEDLCDGRKSDNRSEMPLAHTTQLKYNVKADKHRDTQTNRAYSKLSLLHPRLDVSILHFGRARVEGVGSN